METVVYENGLERTPIAASSCIGEQGHSASPTWWK